MKSFFVVASMVFLFTLRSEGLKGQQLDLSFGIMGVTDTFKKFNSGLDDIYRGSVVINQEGKIFYQRNKVGNVIVSHTGQIIEKNLVNGVHLVPYPGNKMISSSDSLGYNNSYSYGCFVSVLDSNGQVQFKKQIPFDSVKPWKPHLTYDLACLSDSSILLTVCFEGMFWDNHTYVCKLKRNGDMDSSFGHYGVLRYPTNYQGGVVRRYLTGSLSGMFINLAIVTDIYDNLYLGVLNNNLCNSVLKYNKYGIADSNFNANTNVWSTGVSDCPSRLLIDYQGNIVVIGGGSSITRINSMGNLDTTFNGSGFIQGTGSNWQNGYFVEALIEADNKIVLIKNSNYQAIAGNKINVNGTIDSTWHLGYTYYCTASHPSLVNVAMSIAIQPDGKLVMPFVYQPNSWCNGPIGGRISRIARFNNNQCGNGNVPSDLAQPTVNNLISCAHQPVRFKLNGNLHGASLWKYYTNWDSSLKVIYADSLKVYPSQTTTYYFKGVGACVTDGPLDSLTISVLPMSSYSIYETTCNSFYFNGQSLTTSGVYYDTLTNQYGCDSLVILNLTINTSNGSVMNETACNTFFFNGQSLTTSGVYYDTLTNQYGCDSLVILNLTINSSNDSVMNETACDSFYFNGQSLTTSGVYYDTLTNQYGCDSLVILNLTINTSNGSVMNETACNTFFFNGQSLTISGVYYDTLTNQYGCDSLVTLNLTINSSNDSVMNETACNTFYFNGQSLTTSGVYYDTLTNQYGCDSLVILNLTINSSNGSVMNETACNSFYFNGQSLTSSGIYYDTLINQYGCDSIITLNLTIQNMDTTIHQSGVFLSANAKNVTYQWLSCNPFRVLSGFTEQQFIAVNNGDYAVEVSKNGCADTTACVTVWHEDNQDIVIIPNPATNYIDVFNRFTPFVELAIYIHNTLGQVVHEEKISARKSGTRIDISHLPTGVYYVQCSDKVMKLLKE